MKTSTRTFKLVASAAATLVVAAQIAPGALAVTSPDQTRDTYTAAVEPICKTNAKTTEQLLGNVKKMVKEGKLKPAGVKVTKAAESGEKTVAKLKQVAQPSADAAKLGKWLGYLDKEQKFLNELAKALKTENKSRVNRLTIELTHNGNQANTAALGFDFKYCLIPTDQFA